MSEIMEDIAYLSQEIGPRPAGTEEEQHVLKEYFGKFNRFRDVNRGVRLQFQAGSGEGGALRPCDYRKHHRDDR